MNLRTFFIEQLIKVRFTGIIKNGRVQATPEQIEQEISRRLELARNNRDLFYKYQMVGLI